MNTSKPSSSSCWRHWAIKTYVARVVKKLSTHVLQGVLTDFPRCCFPQHTIRALALRVLKEILRNQPARFKNYAELTIMKTLEAHKDSHKEVSVFMWCHYSGEELGPDSRECWNDTRKDTFMCKQKKAHQQCEERLPHSGNRTVQGEHVILVSTNAWGKYLCPKLLNHPQSSPGDFVFHQVWLEQVYFFSEKGEEKCSSTIPFSLKKTGRREAKIWSVMIKNFFCWQEENVNYK